MNRPAAHSGLSGAELAALGPPPATIPDAAPRIRHALLARNAWTVILDDDPTGSQCVHGVPVVTRWERADIAWACDQPTRAFFVLTNTRAMPTYQARRVVAQVAGAVDAEVDRRGGTVEWVVRGDSTLRGNYPAEGQVLRERAQDRGHPFTAEIFVPAYLEAGRVTASDTHYVREGESYRPVGTTEYARDATYHYRSSNLRDYIAEKWGGGLAAADVGHITLDDLRRGGPQRVASILQAGRPAPIAVNAVEYTDLEILALGMDQAQRNGARILTQAGPSFVSAYLGISRRRPLSHADIFGISQPAAPGLVAVGSHVPLSSRQVDMARQLPGLSAVELDVPALLRGQPEVSQCAARVVKELQVRDVMLLTSRDLVAGTSALDSLAVAARVSQALVEVVRVAVEHVRLGWVIAKGGITSSDLATKALGIARAYVLGQLFSGRVSVWRTVGASHVKHDLPYVVFAGNVGEDDSLLSAISVMRGDLDQAPPTP